MRGRNLFLSFCSTIWAAGTVAFRVSAIVFQTSAVPRSGKKKYVKGRQRISQAVNQLDFIWFSLQRRTRYTVYHVKFLSAGILSQPFLFVEIITVTIHLLSCISWSLHVAANVCVPTDDYTVPAPEKTLAHLDAITFCHVKFQKSTLCASMNTIAALDHLRERETILPLPHPASVSISKSLCVAWLKQRGREQRHHLWKKANRQS